MIFVWFSKDLDTARGGGEEVYGICSLHHVEMPWSMDEIIWGDSLLRSPHSRSIFWILSHLFLPLLHWKMLSLYYVMCPYPMGHSAEGHAPLSPIPVPVGSCLEAILVAHICIGLGALFVEICINSQSTKWCLFL